MTKRVIHTMDQACRHTGGTGEHMTKQIVSDSRGIAYKMHGRLYRTTLPNGSVRAQEQPTELAALIGITNQMFAGHRELGRRLVARRPGSRAFDQLKDLVGSRRRHDLQIKGTSAMTTRKIEDMVAHATRHLDGTKVNVDRMAQDVLDLADLVNRYRAAAGAPIEDRPLKDKLSDAASGVGDAFGDIFGDIFK